MWLNKFKIAIVEKNADEIDKLLDEVPKFSNKRDTQEAMFLMSEGTKVLYQLKDEAGEIISQLKKNIDFLNSTQTPIHRARLDVIS